ncbi:MAG: NeuD/PglB/VioB family sugar acetyltransferase [Chloroflexi bacterium]|nr:NeuD/PglB/VioB family sugar acetyltransferase [Chloroflexota bacterium]
MTNNNNEIKCLIAGAGDHARVLIDVIKSQRLPEFQNWEIVALTDLGPELHGKSVMDVPVVGNDEELPKLLEQGIGHALVGIGLIQGTAGRTIMFDKLTEMGFAFPIVIHPSARISSNVEIDVGSVILTGAIVGTGCRIGKNVIVNIGASVSHDCTVADNAVISDGACIAGGVKLGKAVLVGAGATILPYVSIGEGATVAGGGGVHKDVCPGVSVVGAPERHLAPRPN